MEDKLLNKEISEENSGVSNDLRHTTNSLQNATFELFKLHVLSAIDNIREKKKAFRRRQYFYPHYKKFSCKQ